MKERCLALISAGVKIDHTCCMKVIQCATKPSFMTNVAPTSADRSRHPKIRRRAAVRGRSPVVRRFAASTRDWPTYIIIAVQAGLFAGVITLWEIGARVGLIYSSFFWSRPSAIYQTAKLFFASGAAYFDIAYTFSATILGFVIGTTLGSLIGLSFWWSRNYTAVVQPYIICFESMRKLALTPIIILAFGAKGYHQNRDPRLRLRSSCVNC